jgi:hypothetical protein
VIGAYNPLWHDPDYAWLFDGQAEAHMRDLRRHYRGKALQDELRDTDLVLQAAVALGDVEQATALLRQRQRTLSQLCALAPDCPACALPHADGAGGAGEKLLAPAGLSLDAPWLDEGPRIDESRMSVRFCFADGNRRDNVGDLLEIGGIDCSRHRVNPIIALDHFRNVPLPVALAEDRATREYTVELDVIGKRAYCTAFFYQGDNEQGRLAEQVFDLIVKRVIRSGSIGYLTVKSLPLSPDFERGLPAGNHLLRVLLLECSFVVIPANQDTVVKALNTRGLSPWLVKALRPHAPPCRAQLGYEPRTACKCGRCVKCLRARYGRKATADGYDPESGIYRQERREQDAHRRQEQAAHGHKGAAGMPSYAAVPKPPEELRMERSRPRPGPSAARGALGPRLPRSGAGLKELREHYGRKALVKKTDKRGREYCYNDEVGAFGRVPCNPVNVGAHVPGPSGEEAPRGPGHARPKYHRFLRRAVSLAVRRKVLHGLKNEKELADAWGAYNLPDSEPADCILLFDALGEAITDPETIKHHMVQREDAVRALRTQPADSPQAKHARELLTRHTALFVECKTLITSKRGAFQMSDKARHAKERWRDRYGVPFVTVCFDDRRGHKHSGNRLYIKAGAGSASIADMRPVADFSELLGAAGEALQ